MPADRSTRMNRTLLEKNCLTIYRFLYPNDEGSNLIFGFIGGFAV